ncbi:fused response regulator/phosphatase [Mucilaginibacter psychrotolerans]|uniref:Fused response regulator/phosphatase n=1 Tax=Mucilaginibacter psychrotolerans TaxID=1524096 RepID=A0A4Y8SKF4_9SPHI|nr:fused response regulator/phosphatase [Mucilaginibacter psychrotolerans]TFF39569.1 fused response regulator/phosphatase [Mucilaginibacter psychrotolerans]
MPVSKKILLVDDNPLVLEMMGRALSKEGFECMKAASAQQAIQLLQQQLPDIILSDYHMPDVDGFLFRQQLLAHTAYKDIPFMFLTSEVDNQLMLQGINLDAVDYILKDTPVAVVVSKINNFLNTVREQHERTLKELSKAAMSLNLHSVPKTLPMMKGFEADFWHKPFQNYPGGDFIDFIAIDSRYTFIVLGDVMGKKWGAWYFSFGFLSYIRAAVRICIAEGNFSTRSILQKINSVVYHDPVVSDVLSSLSLVLLDNEERTLKYSGAGDLPLLYYNAKDKQVSQVRSAGMLLGLMPDGDFDEIAITPGIGDQLFIFTDGLIDTETPSGKKTDYAAFEAAVSPYLGMPFDEFKKSTFLADKANNQVDDCSLIFLQKTAG